MTAFKRLALLSLLALGLLVAAWLWHGREGDGESSSAKSASTQPPDLRSPGLAGGSQGGSTSASTTTSIDPRPDKQFRVVAPDGSIVGRGVVWFQSTDDPVAYYPLVVAEGRGSYAYWLEPANHRAMFLPADGSPGLLVASWRVTESVDFVALQSEALSDDLVAVRAVDEAGTSLPRVEILAARSPWEGPTRFGPMELSSPLWLPRRVLETSDLWIRAPSYGWRRLSTTDLRPSGGEVELRPSGSVILDVSTNARRLLEIEESGHVLTRFWVDASGERGMTGVAAGTYHANVIGSSPGKDGEGLVGAVEFDVRANDTTRISVECPEEAGTLDIHVRFHPDWRDRIPSPLRVQVAPASVDDVGTEFEARRDPGGELEYSMRTGAIPFEGWTVRLPQIGFQTAPLRSDSRWEIEVPPPCTCRFRLVDWATGEAMHPKSVWLARDEPTAVMAVSRDPVDGAYSAHVVAGTYAVVITDASIVALDEGMNVDAASSGEIVRVRATSTQAHVVDAVDEMGRTVEGALVEVRLTDHVGENIPCRVRHQGASLLISAAAEGGVTIRGEARIGGVAYSGEAQVLLRRDKQEHILLRLSPIK